MSVPVAGGASQPGLPCIPAVTMGISLGQQISPWVPEGAGTGRWARGVQRWDHPL